MPKRVIFAAFVVDDEDYFDGEPGSGPVGKQEFASFLSNSFNDVSGIEHVMVWDNIEELLEDRYERGPITVAYVRGD